jgi:aryl-alcohol dehydrogenase-like predicted oxidoreductase
MWFNYDKGISVIGQGCWGVGNDVYGARSQEQDKEILKSTMPYGVNFFDTSPFYGNSEKIVGDFFKERKTRFANYIATKIGMIGENQWSFDKSYMIKSINQSIANIGNIYLLQIHSPPIEMITEDVIKMMLSFVDTKTTQYWGISYKSPNDAVTDLKQAKYKKLKKPDFIQINYGLLDQRAKTLGLLDYCYDEKISIIARTPFCFGYLCNDIKDGELEQTDHRLKCSEQQKSKWKSGFEIFKQFKSPNETMAQFALRFCWSTPGIVTTIPGANTPAQAIENGTLANRKFLTHTELQKLYQTYLKYEG